MCGATAGNGDATALGSTPREAVLTDAVSTVVMGEGTFSGNVRAGVGRRAPGSSGFESQTGTAVVMGGATAGDVDTLFLDLTP